MTWSVPPTFSPVAELAVRVTELGVELQDEKSVWLRVTADSRELESQITVRELPC